MATDMMTFPLDNNPLHWPCAQTTLTWFNVEACYPPAEGECVIVRYSCLSVPSGSRYAIAAKDGYVCAILGTKIFGVTHYAYVPGPDQKRLIVK